MLSAIIARPNEQPCAPDARAQRTMPPKEHRGDRTGQLERNVGEVRDQDAMRLPTEEQPADVNDERTNRAGSEFAARVTRMSASVSVVLSKSDVG